MQIRCAQGVRSEKGAELSGGIKPQYRAGAREVGGDDETARAERVKQCDLAVGCRGVDLELYRRASARNRKAERRVDHRRRAGVEVVDEFEL